ncbi:MAG: ATP-binding cassette domain-containing protein, partial [Tenericutes bacterium]|nr:ATP-binding cassette domain-containing protein [Mycoplasmatota bacterium]
MEIVVKNLTKKFKDVIILDDINIEFDRGKIYGLIGKNGSGKTVFLKMLAGVYVPTSGSIICKGEDFNLTRSFPKSVRAIIENPTFIPEFSGFENLKMLA